MKKILLRIITAALLCALTVCIFASCDKQGGSNDGGADNDGSSKKVVYAIEYNDAKISLGADATSVVKKIGEPVSKQSTGNCGGLGETVRYDYSSFILVVVEYDSGAKVDQIELRNDLVEAVGGVSIGSSEGAVKKAYGEPSEVKGSTFIYKSGKNRMNIGFEDGYVSFLTMKVEG